VLYCRSPVFPPTIKIYDATTGALINGNLNPTRQSAVMAGFIAQPGTSYGAQVSSATTNTLGGYDVVPYPVVQAGVMNLGNLDATDPADAFRSTGVYYADDYLLQVSVPNVTLNVLGTNFTPHFTVWDLSSGTKGYDFPGLNSQANGSLTDATNRLWVVRVTSEGTNATGGYQLSVDIGAAVTDFSPKMGSVGQLVRIGLTNMNGAAVSSVSFGGFSSSDPAWAPYYAQGKVVAPIPPGARSGKISVTADVTGISTEDFVVLAPLGALSFALAGGGFSFGVSNSGAATSTNFVDSTTNLVPPVVWVPLTTNISVGPGVWRYTNQPGVSSPQRFFRVRVQ
jgi:hypothetical protein